MTIQMTFELSNSQTAQTIVRALNLYQSRLQASVARTRRRLVEFEQRYQVTTPYFLSNMVAEDLPGGDWEYVEWAGEAKLLAGLEMELQGLQHVNYQLP